MTGRPHLPRPALVFLAALLVFGLFDASQRSAQAQSFGPLTIIQDFELKQQSFLQKVAGQIKDKLKIAKDITFKNSIQLFTSRLIREGVTQIATAGPGQKPLFLTNPKTFFKNVANSAAGDFIDEYTRGLTGQTGPGTAISSSRGRFLISRFLRSQLPDPLNSCQEDCRTNFAVRSDFRPDDKNAPVPENDHEKKIAQVSTDLYGSGGTIPTLQSHTPDYPFTCNDVTQPSGPSVPNQPLPWLIQLGASINNPQPTVEACQSFQQEAVNNERASAQAETNQCYKECQTGAAGTASAAIAATTATDVFSAINTIEPSKVPGTIANALSADKSDVGQLLGAFAGLSAAVQNRVTGEQTNLQANTLPRSGTVSDQVLAPSAVTTATLYGLFQVSSSGQFVYTGTGIADILKGIASFINSPVGQLFSQSFRNKCGLNPDACRGPSNPQSGLGQLLFGTGGPSGQAGAQQALSSLGQPQLISGNPGQNDIPITDQLSSSGLIDSGFRQAIEEQLTVQEALDKKLLDSRKVFGFDSNGIESRDGYAYRALQYLRKFRVIPIGWELAAKYKQQFDNRNLTLGKLVKAFNMCGQDPHVCSVSGEICSTDTDCGASGETCSTKFSSNQHQVCSNNPDQQCQDNIDCGAGRCGASPYCGLVDPNWVLKAPQSYCRRQGAGEEIVTKEFICDEDNFIGPADKSDLGQNVPNCNSQKGGDIGRWVISRNTDTCADVQSCIAENDDGSCIAYGYCVQERQVFKFDGTQCDAQNVSCTGYTDSAGQSQNYLANTLDFRNCTADNAGCQWYCHKSCSLDSTRSCTTDADCIPDSRVPPTQAPNKGVCTGGYNAATNTWTCADPTVASAPATNPTINFTDKAATCDQNQAGCNQYIRTTNGSNLLPNGGFELITNGAQVDSGNDGIYADWLKTGGVRAVPITPDDPGVTANNAVAISLSGAATDGLTTSPAVDTGAHLYEQTFSGSIRAKAGADCTATLVVSTNLRTVSTNAAVAKTTPINVTTGWQSLTSTLVVPTQAEVTGTDDNMVTLSIQVGNCSGLVIDSAQLEVDGPTNYKDYGAVNTTYLGASRQQCTREDVGCQLYTPTDGSPAIPGQVLASNRCSAGNVGCNLFHLEPISGLPARSGGDVTVIPEKGQLCSASDVGCEEYTNLDEVASGGEATAYFKQVKQCIKPTMANASNPVAETYYTWVGDPQRGFILRSYDLVKSNIGAGPCTNLSVGTTTGAPTCADTAATVAVCPASDVGENPDCAQYYDSGLTAYYLLRSRTVSVTNDCHPFRNTIDQSTAGRENLVYYLAPSENVSCSAAAAGCRAYTGNAAQTSRQTFREDFETATTSNWVGGSISTASVTLGGHSMLIPASNSAAYMTSVAVKGKIVQGKTYQLSLLAAAATSTLPEFSVFLGSTSGTSFNTVTPFQRDGQGQPVYVKPTFNNTITPPGPEWHSFTFGLVTISGDPSVLTIGIATKLGSSGDFYVDNIVLTEINDSIYAVSSTVPACPASEVGCAAYRDKNGNTANLKSFNRICSQQAVNCEALITTYNSSTPASQTVKNVTTPADQVVTLVNDPANQCQVSAKSCQAFGRPVYGNDRILAGFQTVYLKNDPDQYNTYLCTDGKNNTPNELFCRAFTTSTGTAAFFKDPSNQTCEFRTDSSAAGGQWFVVGTSTLCPTIIPPDVGRPIGPSCAPTCAGGSRIGKACVTSGDCPGSSCEGDASTIGKISSTNGPVIGQCSSDADCLGSPVRNKCLYQVGLCPAEQNGCAEFRDPTDPVSCRSECPLVQQGGSAVLVDSTCMPTICQGGSDAGQNCQSSDDCDGGQCVGSANTPTTGQPGCRPYYYLRQSVEDNSNACNGQVNLATGCRPFNDTANPNLNFRGQ